MASDFIKILIIFSPLHPPNFLVVELAHFILISINKELFFLLGQLSTKKLRAVFLVYPLIDHKPLIQLQKIEVVQKWFYGPKLDVSEFVSQNKPAFLLIIIKAAYIKIL